MKITNYNLIKYEAEDGYVFDWKEPRYHTDVETNTQIQDHLYATILFIGEFDSIENYIEVKIANNANE